MAYIVMCWYTTTIQTTIPLLVPNIFNDWNEITQFSTIRSPDGATKLFQINDLVVFDNTCPSHFRLGL